MKVQTVTLNHSEITTLALEHLRLAELSKDQRHIQRAQYFLGLTGAIEPRTTDPQALLPLVEKGPDSLAGPE